MKEIGGYFGLDQLISNEYYKNLISVNSGRNALLYILKAKKIKKLYIPYYLCNSVSHMLKMNDYDFEYYNIDLDFMPKFKKNLTKHEYLYIVNYYGQLTNERAFKLKQQFKQIILDNTHAFFQKPINGIDTIYSCRKFFGVADGAYVSTDSKIEEELENDISKDKMTHILGRYEGVASDYYSYFQSNDESFKNGTLKYMSKLTHNILGAVDYDRVFKIRNENYSYLENKLGEYNKLKLIALQGAFAYPLYVENGVEIREELAKKKIYISTLWPNVLSDTSEDSMEHKYVENILPLPCDQRYNVEDMDYMVSIIKQLLNLE
ncbi:hypothetical protein [Clostridium botulinum]|uniref:hypothetical protein n=1 Tax=Clostridium botulinum TaxID=1491 RepID=UPI0019679654|nr:hypothetical protein [Clostridium botulinum]MBN1060026.1 hypothetical protein [Clostridium botulinum]MBN1063172.1 hypothetical protein [Clostridium botulinum]